MAESVAALHMEFTASTAALRTELDKAKASVVGMTTDMKRQFAQGRTAVGGQSGEIKKLGDTVKGAGPSIAAMSNALALVGTKGSPAIRGLGTAVSSLAMGGFTPLGLVIGATTGLLALFGQEAEKTTPFISEQEKRIKSLGERYSELEIQIAAANAGMSEEAYRRKTRLEEIAEEEKNVRDTIRAAEENIEQIRIQQRRTGTTGVGSAIPQLEERIALQHGVLVGLREEANRLRATAAREDERAAQRKQEIADLKQLQRLGEEMEARNGIDGTEELDPAMSRAAAESFKERRKADEEFLQTQFEMDLKAWEARFAAIEESPAVYGFNPETGRVDRARGGLDPFEEPEPTDAEQRRYDAWAAWVLGEEKAETALDRLKDSFEDLQTNMREGFGEVFATAIMDADNLGDVLRSLLNSMLRNQLNAIGQYAYSEGSGLLLSAAGSLLGFASGGSFTVGGGGGIDSQLVAFKATPGEQVSITPPGGARGGGTNVSVNVHNYGSQSQVATRTTQGPSGPQIDVLIEDIVARSVRDGGKVGRALDQSYGLRRPGRRS